jgi:hypothetical protein
MIRSTSPRDVGKSPVFQGSALSGMPFNEQQLRQLRAQCLVFLAFRWIALLLELVLVLLVVDTC